LDVDPGYGPKTALRALELEPEMDRNRYTRTLARVALKLIFVDL
jgi:hypothetical protein